MTPPQVDACSLWQWFAAAEGHRRANMTEQERASELTTDEVEALSRLVDSP